MLTRSSQSTDIDPSEPSMYPGVTSRIGSSSDGLRERSERLPDSHEESRPVGAVKRSVVAYEREGGARGHLSADPDYADLWRCKHRDQLLPTDRADIRESES